MRPRTDKKQIAQPRKRIVLVMQYYDPEPVYKGQEFAEAIAASGFEVEVVTGFPNYPGGQLYNGYKIRPWTREVISGIRITRLALYPYFKLCQFFPQFVDLPNFWLQAPRRHLCLSPPRNGWACRCDRSVFSQCPPRG